MRADRGLRQRRRVSDAGANKDENKDENRGANTGAPAVSHQGGCFLQTEAKALLFCHSVARSSDSTSRKSDSRFDLDIV